MMRTTIKLTGFICLAAILGIISCTDDETVNVELSASAKQYLSMRMGPSECDYIITIYEDGKKTVVNLSKDWYRG